MSPIAKGGKANESQCAVAFYMSSIAKGSKADERRCAGTFYMRQKHAQHMKRKRN